jgi:hypothetical protein
MLQQQMLNALDKWSKDQSTERIELLATFTEPVVAAVTAFAVLESSRMQEPPDTVRTHSKILSKLTQFLTAKDTRGQFAAISILLHDAMELLSQAVGVIDFGIDAETNISVHKTERL